MLVKTLRFGILLGAFALATAVPNAAVADSGQLREIDTKA